MNADELKAAFRVALACGGGTPITGYDWDNLAAEISKRTGYANLQKLIETARYERDSANKSAAEWHQRSIKLTLDLSDARAKVDMLTRELAKWQPQPPAPKFRVGQFIVLIRDGLNKEINLPVKVEERRFVREAKELYPYPERFFTGPGYYYRPHAFGMFPESNFRTIGNEET